MPKLHFGSRGGVFYKKNGRKVYISSFGKTKKEVVDECINDIYSTWRNSELTLVKINKFLNEVIMYGKLDGKHTQRYQYVVDVEGQEDRIDSDALLYDILTYIGRGHTELDDEENIPYSDFANRVTEFTNGYNIRGRRLF